MQIIFEIKNWRNVGSNTIFCLDIEEYCCPKGKYVVINK